MAAFDAQYLESGKALCGKNFPGFVSTFNWLVDFCRNLKGDGDLDALCGRVKVDAADPRRPVVRLNADGLGGGGGGGGGEACADELSTTTDTANGAVSAGSISLYGFADAPSGAVPVVASSDGTSRIQWGTVGNFGVLAEKNEGAWNYTVNGGYYTKARKQYHIEGISVSSSGYVYLRVATSSSLDAALVLEEATKDSDSSYTYILLYFLNTSGFIRDYRGAPQIQVWE